MKEIKKAQMGIIAVLAMMLVSITRRLPEARRLSSGITTLTLAGIVLLVAAGSASAGPPYACVNGTTAYFFGDTVMMSCTLNGSMSGSGSGLFIGADGITIDGNNFGITGSNDPWSYGILNYDASQFRGYHNVVIKNLDISGFQEGICIQGTSTGAGAARVENNTIYNCTVHDNGANTGKLQSGCGIHFYQNVWNSTIDNCRVYNTTATLQSSCDSPGAGIRLYSKSCYNDVTNCEIYRNALAGIYSKAGSMHNRIDNNDVYENAAPGADISFPGGIRMQCKNTNWWTVSNNEVWDNYGPGIFVGGQNR
jgi:parallel beta-helix repeat protein